MNPGLIKSLGNLQIPWFIHLRPIKGNIEVKDHNQSNAQHPTGCPIENSQHPDLKAKPGNNVKINCVLGCTITFWGIKQGIFIDSTF